MKLYYKIKFSIKIWFFFHELYEINMSSNFMQNRHSWSRKTSSNSQATYVDVTIWVACKRRFCATSNRVFLFSNVFPQMFSRRDTRRVFLLSHARRITLFAQNPSSNSQTLCCRTSILSKFLSVVNLLTWRFNRKRNADYESRESRCRNET